MYKKDQNLFVLRKKRTQKQLTIANYYNRPIVAPTILEGNVLFTNNLMTGLVDLALPNTKYPWL